MIRRVGISATIINKYAEKGSPCLQPRYIGINSDKKTFCMTALCMPVLKSFIQDIKLFVKPNKDSTLYINFQDIES